MKSTAPAAAQTPQASAEHAPIVVAASAQHDGLLELPLGNALLDAEFNRLGRDLQIFCDHHSPSLLVTDYFAQSQMPALLSESGKLLRPETVNLLSGGDLSAHQYAGPVTEAADVAPIGTVEKLDGDVFVTRGGEEVQLHQGDAVYQNDIIRTEGDGAVGIGFVDGSVFSLGHDARMTLDSLVYDPATGEGSSEVTVIKGMFHFVSGDIAANNPGDMVVDTPVATIGIRGTTGGGDVQGPGLENQFYLEPNADGTIGWFDVTTHGGTVSMNQPYMQVNVGSITAPPPAPHFTTPEALQQHFQTVESIAPEGRYDPRPESSSLLHENTHADAPPPAQPQSQAQDSMAETQALQPAEPIFDRAPDPTKTAIEQFVENGTAKEQLTTAQLAHPLAEARHEMAEQHSEQLHDAHTQLSEQLRAELIQQAKQHNDMAAQNGDGSVRSYFETLQDQVRIGNLPLDTFTQQGGTGSTVPPLTSMNDALLETLQGTAGNDAFRVTTWANYSNPNAPAANVADILLGGAGVDKLNLLSHTATFGIADFNAGSSGIDAINFNDSSISSLTVTVDNALIDQSDNDTLSLFLNDKAASVDVSGITDSSYTLQLTGAGNSVNITGGTAAKILLGGTDMDVTTDGAGALNITALGGEHVIDFSGSSQSYQATLAAGSSVLSLGSGDDSVTVRGGTQFVDGGIGEDSFLVTGGSGHSIDGGSGDNRFELHGVSGSGFNGGTGNDAFLLSGGSANSITTGGGQNRVTLVNTADASVFGGNGSDNYELRGSTTATITDSFSAGAGNHYAFSNFSGIAGITAFSAVSSGNDTLDIRSLAASGKVNVTLDNSNGTTSNVALDLNGSDYMGQTYSRVGDALVITTRAGAGGKVVLNDFFTGQNDYDLLLDNHDPFAAVHGSNPSDSRALDGSYNFTGILLDSASTAIETTSGSQVITVHMANHGFATGDSVSFSGIGSVGGLTSGELNGAHTITIIDANTFSYTVASAASTTDSSTGAGISLDFTQGFYTDISDFAGANLSGATGQGYILGHGGNDTIIAADDGLATVIHGGDGNDHITGATGDVLKGGHGQDVLMKLAGAGAVTFYGGDTVDDNFDIVDYSNQSSGVVIDLNATAQTGAGAANGDSLNGIEGIIGTGFADTLTGADGIGKFNYFDGGAGADIITGGVGARNTVSYQWMTATLSVTLDASGNATVGGQAGGDTLSNIQNILGGNGTNNLTGNAQDNILAGGSGVDTLIGGDGADILIGGGGNDTLKMGVGSATDTSHDVAVFSTNNGVDTLYGFTADGTAAAQQDAMDISAILRDGNLMHMNYFDLLGKGLLQVVGNGANSDIKIDLDGIGGAGLTKVASVLNTDPANFDWKHFITSDHSTYLVDTSGSASDNDNDVIVASGGTNINGYSGNDIIEIQAAGSASINAGQGNDAVVLDSAAIFGSAMSIDGGEGMDRLVLNAGALDFSGIDSSNISNFEILDLYGSNATNLKAEDVFNLTGDGHSLFVESSKAGASLGLEAAGWHAASAQELADMPATPDANLGDYTTYVADYNGTEVYVHINNSVTQT